MIQFKTGMILASAILILCPIAYATIADISTNNLPSSLGQGSRIHVVPTQKLQLSIPTSRNQINKYDINYEGLSPLLAHNHRI